MTNIDIIEIRKAILESDAKWEADETSFMRMPEDVKKNLLGYIPGPEDPSLEEQELIARTNFDTFLTLNALEATYPSSYDLTNVDGQNFITNVKNQGNCGSCVAFGVAATTEGTLRRQRNKPNLPVDYSEARLFYCYARSQGRTCFGDFGGWWPEKALDFFRDDGVADELCYPYVARDQNCTNLCSNWESRVTKITGWHQITSPAKMKEWISTKGPLIACFSVYEDFYSYGRGIYKHVSGKFEGGHCVCCVGYDDVQKYWICKNSWGTGFGDGGYFRIAYGDCGIDARMDAVDQLLTSTINKRLEARGFSYPISIRHVANSFGILPPISINELMEKLE